MSQATEDLARRMEFRLNLADHEDFDPCSPMTMVDPQGRTYIITPAMPGPGGTVGGASARSLRNKARAQWEATETSILRAMEADRAASELREIALNNWTRFHRENPSVDLEAMTGERINDIAILKSRDEGLEELYRRGEEEKRVLEEARQQQQQQEAEERRRYHEQQQREAIRRAKREAEEAREEQRRSEEHLRNIREEKKRRQVANEPLRGIRTLEVDAEETVAECVRDVRRAVVAEQIQRSTQTREERLASRPYRDPRPRCMICNLEGVWRHYYCPMKDLHYIMDKKK